MLAILAHNVGNSTSQGWELARQWSFTNPTLVVLAGLGYLYARGLRHWPDPRPFDSWRPYSFYTGLAIGILALISPIDAMADDLFLAHMVQHQLLMIVAAPLVLLGAPTTPVLRGLPRWARRGLVAPMMRDPTAQAIASFIMFPPITWLLFTGNMWAWHFVSGAFDAATGNRWLHLFQHWTFGITSVLFWWTIIDPRPLRSRLAYPLRVLFLGVTLLQNVALGAGITFQKSILYPYYESRPRLWGISPLDDQQAGGLVMWVAGDLMLVAAVLATLLVWFIKEERKTRQREAEMDAALRRSGAASSAPRAPQRGGDLAAPRPGRSVAYWKDSGPPR